MKRAKYQSPITDVVSLQSMRETMQLIVPSQNPSDSTGAEDLNDPVVVGGEWGDLFS